MIRDFAAVCFAYVSGCFLAVAYRISSRVVPELDPSRVEFAEEPEPVIDEPEPEEGDEPDCDAAPQGGVYFAERLPLRYALMMAGEELASDAMPPGMQLAWMAAGARPLAGGPRPVISTRPAFGRGPTWPVN